MVAEVNPLLRVRFSTSNPQDISDAVIQTMARYPNICHHIHLPVQSGSDRILEKMRRRYTRAWYLERVAKIRELIPAPDGHIYTLFREDDMSQQFPYGKLWAF